MYFATFGAYNPNLSGGNKFISTWDTTKAGVSDNDQVLIPFVDVGTYNCVIEWGDGSSDTITAYDDAALLHTYSEAGQYTISISGDFFGFKFNNGGDRLKITGISAFGNADFAQTGGNNFYGCENLIIEPTDVLSVVTNLYLFMANNYLNNHPITWLDSKDVTTFHGMFLGNAAFNQEVSILDFSKATSIYSFMYGCSSFNKDLILNTSSLLTTCRATLSVCTSFNSTLDFNTENVTDFNGFLFFCSSFNKTLANLDFSSGQDLENLLYGATSFNQDLSVMDLSSATTIKNMCNGCTSLVEGDLSNQTMTNLADMEGVFDGCTALTTIDLTNTSIGSTGKTAANFAKGCTSLTDIVGLDAFDVSSLTNMTDFLTGSSIPTQRYSDALIYWATLTLQNDVVCTMGSSTYNAAGETAKNYIIANFNWTFNDGGLAS